ncbi:MAG: hypothetical protein ACLQVJ_07655, partial [Syntrophobacteraceae bacterium]
RDQYLMLILDERRAIEAIPTLLKGHEDEAKGMLEYIRQIATAGGPLSEEAQRRMIQVEQLFSGPTTAGAQ